MNAGEFIKRRAKIADARTRPNWWHRRAFDKLLREAKGVPVVMHHRVIGWTLPSGEMVCIKQRFKSEVAALSTLRQIDAEPHIRPHQPVRAYACYSCNGWHITSEA